MGEPAQGRARRGQQHRAHRRRAALGAESGDHGPSRHRGRSQAQHRRSGRWRELARPGRLDFGSRPTRPGKSGPDSRHRRRHAGAKHRRLRAGIAGSIRVAGCGGPANRPPAHPGRGAVRLSLPRLGLQAPRCGWVGRHGPGRPSPDHLCAPAFAQALAPRPGLSGYSAQDAGKRRASPQRPAHL